MLSVRLPLFGTALCSLLVASPLLAIAEEEPVGIAAQEQTDEESGLVDFTINGEYRLRSLQIHPVELGGTSVRDISWTEQRARIDAAATVPGVISITLQADALSGVLLGDNGRFLGDPSSSSGVSLATKTPNLTRWEIGLLPGGDPLNREDYGPVLTEADLLNINFLYADANLPFGILRLGRQPLNYGATITAHEGGRYNRWGVSQYADAADRILFGTKIDEIIKTLSDPDHVADASLERGVVLAMFYDFFRQNDIATTDDNLRQMGVNMQWLVDEADWFGQNWRGLQISGTFTHLRNEQFGTRIYAFPLGIKTGINNVDFTFQFSHLRGETSEIAEGFGALQGRSARPQRLEAYGAHGLIDLHLGPVTLSMEANYASGDASPRVTDPINTFSFARDFNVGLLLFEHILAFESARSVAVGIENLSDLDMESFPLTEIQTDGRFSNAIALFPQIHVKMLERPEHSLFARAGVLAAWSATSLGVVDAIQTALNDAGGPIEDNAINYHGGVPARFYGTELDLQLGYKFRENFFWTVEAAVLFPGAALYNEHGLATRSFLVENRFEILF